MANYREPALELLETIFSGTRLDEASLDAFLARCVPEGLHLDYKRGLQGPKFDAAAVLREYVSAFANSDGGVLIMGVEEKQVGGLKQPGTVTGCDVQGASSLHDWATRCLHSLAPYCSPQPKIQEVARKSSPPVLVVAVARAPGLVPLVEKSRLAYHVRIGDSTLQVPEYLLSDLVLGRRRHPQLLIQNPSLGASMIGSLGGPNPAAIVPFGLEVVNDGLAWAEEFLGGAVCWYPKASRERISRQLRAYLDERPPPEELTKTWLRHLVNASRAEEQPSPLAKAALGALDVPESYSLKPFGSRHVPFTAPIALPWPGLRRACWFGAYVLAKGSPPVWSQFLVKPKGGSTWTIEIVEPDGDHIAIAWED